MSAVRRERQVAGGWEEERGGKGLRDGCLEESSRIMFDTIGQELTERQWLVEQVPEERRGTGGITISTRSNWFLAEETGREDGEDVESSCVRV